MIAKGDVRIGLQWRFGPNWPGQRCGAKTRSGSPCKRPANKQKGRCRLHGGASTGPKTKEGRAIIARSNTKNGRYTKAKLAERKRQAMITKELWARRKMIELQLSLTKNEDLYLSEFLETEELDTLKTSRYKHRLNLWSKQGRARKQYHENETIP